MNNLKLQWHLIKKIKRVEQQLHAQETQLNKHKQYLYQLFQENRLLLSAASLTVLFVAWKINTTARVLHVLKQSLKLLWLTQF